MKEELKKALILTVAIIFAFFVLIGSFTLVDFMNEQHYNPECIKLGYSEYEEVGSTYNTEHYCIDDKGIFHRMVFKDGKLTKLKTAQN